MNTEQATIVADATLARYKERLTTRLQPLIQRNFQDFLPKFVGEVIKHLAVKGDSLPPDASLYPDGTKFCFKNNQTCCLVIEQKPQVRTIQFLIEGEKGFNYTKTHWKLAFPYVVIVQVFNWNKESKQWIRGGTAAGYSNEPIRSLSDVIFHPNLPNINEYQVCSGKVFTSRGTISEQTEQAVSHFWTGVFSIDWSDGYKNSPVGKAAEWEKLTIRDPFAVLKAKWNGALSVKDLLGKAGLKYDESMHAAHSYTTEMLQDAAKEAWREVVEECKGVDTESLDKMLLEEMTKYLTEKETI